MFIALAIGFFFLGSIATLFILIAPAMLSSQISREEEVTVNKQLIFSNQIVLDAEFEECSDLPVAAKPSLAIVRIPTYSPMASRKAAVNHRKIDLYA